MNKNNEAACQVLKITGYISAVNRLLTVAKPTQSAYQI